MSRTQLAPDSRVLAQAPPVPVRKRLRGAFGRAVMLGPNTPNTVRFKLSGFTYTAVWKASNARHSARTAAVIPIQNAFASLSPRQWEVAAIHSDEARRAWLNIQSMHAGYAGQWEVTIQHAEFSQQSRYYNDASLHEACRQAREDAIANLRVERSNRKAVAPRYRFEVDQGPEYDPEVVTIGWEEPDAMRKYLRERRAALLRRKTTPDGRRARWLAVELECVLLQGKAPLRQALVALRDDAILSAVHIKDDGSIDPDDDRDIMDVTQTAEVVVCAPRRQLPRILRAVCAAITSPEVGGYVNTTCGTHVHIDQRKVPFNKVKKRFAKFVSAQRLLRRLTPSHRHGGSYCMDNSVVPNWLDGRYSIINGHCAYEAHKTIEVRLLEGTLDPELILGWIGLLLLIESSKYVPNPARVPRSTQAWLQSYGAPDELQAFAARRLAEFNRGDDGRRQRAADSVEVGADADTVQPQLGAPRLSRAQREQLAYPSLSEARRTDTLAQIRRSPTFRAFQQEPTLFAAADPNEPQ